MSLLPIIYTSLLIFTVVMTVVLIVSYLSYKAKRRNSAPENSIYENTVHHDASIIINRPTYAVPQTVPVPVYSQPARTQYQEPRRVSSTTQQITRHDQRRDSKDFSNRKRFQVMNNTRSEYISKFQASPAVGYSTVAAPEFNFLNYYSDQKEEKLNHISVNRYKNNR